MAKYIDADLLRKEIEFAKSVYSNPQRVVHGVADAFRQDGRAAMCDDILKKIDSLQQEQKEEPDKSLEEEINRYFEPIHTADIQFEPFTQMTKCARHFAEWQKEQMMEDAKDGWVDEECVIVLNDGTRIDLQPDCEKKPAFEFEYAQDVRVIVLPKED